MAPLGEIATATKIRAFQRTLCWIRRHYLDLKSADEAEDYWSILPQRAISEAIPLGRLMTTS